jgi:hypothetical protein
MSAAPLKRPLLLAGCLAILAAGQAGLAAPDNGVYGTSRPQGARREAMLRQRAEAISQLSSDQRQAFFSELERLERSRANDRLNQIGTLKSCMVQARGLSEVQSCQNALEQNRRLAMQQRRTSMSSLRQRFGLPARERNRQQGFQPGTQGI